MQQHIEKANDVRRVRKAMQWSVVPMGVLAVLYLSSPIALFLCFLAMGVLVLAAWAGVVEEQFAAWGESWLWQKADALPRRVVWSKPVTPRGGYRQQYVEPAPERVVARKLHWLTRAVALLPVTMGGRGLGWRLATRALRREVMGVVEEVRERVVRRLEAWHFVQLVRSTHVGCPGASCEHCKSIGMMSGEELQERVARDVTEADIERIMPPWLKRWK